MQHDRHFLAVCRYVEANALRANLVKRAEEWRWCSLWRTNGDRADEPPRIEPWPVTRPQGWVEQVNQAGTPAEIDALRRCAQRGTPFGQAQWVQGVANRLGLQCTLRPRGRPGKGS